MTFEEWKERDFFPQDRAYITPEMAFNAGRKAGMEEAAEIAEQSDGTGYDVADDHAYWIAEAISKTIEEDV